jgi:hypothetical protein
MKTCGICVDDVQNLINCPYCDYGVCTKCQNTFEKPSCMNCRSIFPKRFVSQTMGKKYIKTIYNPFVLDSQIQAEKQFLPLVQPFVDWEINRRFIVSQKRFGICMKIPPAPTIPELHIGSVFACPKSTCRGFISSGSCGVCKSSVCGKCRETMTESHVCNEDTIKTLNTLNMDCKACPKCHTLIHKSVGCNHIKCTFCGVHFDYRTLNMLMTSTNHHYDTVPIFGTMLNSTDMDYDICELGTEDGIPQDVFMKKNRDKTTLRLLYEDMNNIRFLKHTKCDEATILEKSNKELHDMRIKFLMKETTEKKWIQRIMYVYNTRDRSLAYSNILQLLIISIKNVQKLVYNKEITIEQMRERLKNTYYMVDSNLMEIQDELGGVTLRARMDIDDVVSPPISFV